MGRLQEKIQSRELKALCKFKVNHEVSLFFYIFFLSLSILIFYHNFKLNLIN
jgi:hypothetical protein